MTARSFHLVVLIVLDGLGVGELPDAARFGDAGSNTPGNLADAGATLSEMFGVDRPAHGESFCDSLPSFQKHPGRV